ncbi:MAG: GlmU family protein [Ignavibacteriaceae bacterium]|nr:GlmU family protein [Ignavibacteriaceae bacterium]
MQICIFEDEKYSNFYPLSYTRPVYELVCGINTLREKIIRAGSDINVSLHCRQDLEATLKHQHPGVEINRITDNSCLFINGRMLASEDLTEIVLKDSEDCVYKSGDEIAAVRLSKENLTKIKNNFNDILNFLSFPELSAKTVDVKLYNYLWEMISDNGSEIVKDAELLTKDKSDFTNTKNFDGVSFINADKIFIKKNANINPGVVIDATNGAVYIDDNVFILPNAVIEGPVYIGKDSKIKIGAAIYENVSIGSNCKIGGEVEDSIILSYTNKQHAGFIGHSYLGSWVNLGADTNCSDLKNNYSAVKVNLNGKSVDTGMQFLGVIIGDHSKSAINTMFNTGTIIGISSNIFGAGFPQKYIPSFSWGGTDGLTTYELNKSIQTAKIVFGRRKKEFTSEDEKLLETVFSLTKEERE